MGIGGDYRNGTDGLVTEAIVLAGGHSTRMGRDKALLPMGEEPLLVYLVRKLQAWGMRVTIAAGREERASRYEEQLRACGVTEGFRFASDQYPDCGPMAGLHASLQAMPEGYAFAVACDMPFISRSLFQRMTNHISSGADLIGMPNQPFHALYHTRAVSRLASHLEEGKLRMMSLLQEMRVILVRPEGDAEGAAATNLNDMDAYRNVTDNM